MDKDILKNTDKDNKAVAIGFFLILGVFAITLGRHYLPEKNKELSKESSLSQDTQKMLELRKTTYPVLVSELKGGNNVEVWDLRDSEAFKREHIVDSRNINPENITEAIKQHDESKKYVLIDNFQDLSPALIAGIFSDDRYNNVYYLDGGFSKWKENFGPVITDGDPYSITDQAKVSYISSDDLKNLTDQGGADLLIIDLRRPASYADSHIKGSVNIFLDDLEMKRNIIPMGKKIILCDNDGLWAFQGAVRMADMGIFNVFALSDGLDEWKQKGYDLEK